MRPGKKNIRHIILTIFIAVVFYLILSFVLTYPIGFNLNSGALEWKGDVALCVWNLWWVNKSIVELHISPFYTDYIFYPTGVNLSYHSFSFYNTLLGIPLIQIFGLIPSYILLIILTFFIAGLGAFLLSRNEGLGITASLAAGFIYGFSPYHLGEFGRIDSTSIHWIPFAVLFMLRIFRGGRLLDGVMAGIFLGLVALCSWYYAIFAILMFFCISFYTLFHRNKNFAWKTFITNSLVQFVTFFAIVFPFSYPILKTMITKSEVVARGAHATIWAELLGFSRGSIGQSLEFLLAWPAVLGYIASAFFLYALLKIKWRDKGLWIFLAAFFFILALGPRLIIGGYEVPFIRLPEVIFYYLPILSSIRAPYRFTVIVSLVFAVIAGHGIDNLLKSITTHFKKPILVLSTILLFVLLIAEVWIVPLPVKKVNVPEFYSKLGMKAGNFAILEVPGSVETWSSAMFYQTFHGKKIVGGYTGFSNPEFKFIENSPVLSALTKMQIDQFKNDKQVGSEEIISTLRNMNIHYVIVHLDSWYCLKTGTTIGQKLMGSPLEPLFLRGFPIRRRDITIDGLLKLFLSSKEGNKFKEVFGEPIFADKNMVVYNVFNRNCYFNQR
jgi:hypothetical protein